MNYTDVWKELYPEQPFYSTQDIYVYTYNMPCSECYPALINKYSTYSQTLHLGYSKFYDMVSFSKNYGIMLNFMQHGWGVKLVEQIDYRYGSDS
jgi:hypothetical protein